MLSEDELVLVRRCQENDEAAFDALFHRYFNRVYALVRQYVGNEEEARDLAQEVFVRVYAHIRSFRGESAFSTWLYRVTVNVCLEQRRKWARRGKYAAFVPMEDVDRELSSEDEDPMDAAARRRTQERVQAAVAALPDPHR
ncbi:MAG: sigma-70 family RNA polymerase sigma factor, partial [Armatimonadota bacterium]|nr:sigma-70 family RNA polymerase sigma factor [Armatimonadota bacterium]